MDNFIPEDILIRKRQSSKIFINYTSSRYILNELKEKNGVLYDSCENLIDDLYRLKNMLNEIGFARLDVEAENYETLRRIQKQARDLAQKTTKYINDLNTSHNKLYRNNKVRFNSLLQKVEASKKTTDSLIQHLSKTNITFED